MERIGTPRNEINQWKKKRNKPRVCLSNERVAPFPWKAIVLIFPQLSLFRLPFTNLHKIDNNGSFLLFFFFDLRA